MSTQDTKALLDRARSGDRAAFESLCQRLGDRLMSAISSQLGALLRSRIEPEDIRQETLLRAFESINVFRGTDERSFFAWLSSIAEHLIWNASQKHSFKQSSLQFDISASADSPSTNLRRQERLERLESSLSELKPDQRRAILLSKIDGLPVKTIAERMRKSEDAIKQLLSRGLRQLRTKFGDTKSLHLPEDGLRRGDDDELA